MRNASWAVVVAAALSGLLALASGVRADEEKVPLAQVPKAVLDAVKAKFPKGVIKEASKEVEDGKTTFEVELTLDGRGVDVSLKPDGTILEIEKEIAVSALPAAVTAALKAKYPEGTIKEAEEVTEGDEDEVEYEVVVVTVGKKTMVIKLEKTGKILETEEHDEKD